MPKSSPLIELHRELAKRNNVTIGEYTIIFIKMGDFYETFEENAKIAAPITGLALTRRNEIPMCGFPVHSDHIYIKKLKDAGYRVLLVP